ncbi:MAG: hypothetical protein QM594_05605 [Niabella sp.]
MKYKISKEADKDPRKHLDLYSQKLVCWTDRYYNLLMDEIEYVSESPQSGKDYSHTREGYFRTQIKSHFIL